MTFSVSYSRWELLNVRIRIINIHVPYSQPRYKVEINTVDMTSKNQNNTSINCLNLCHWLWVLVSYIIRVMVFACLGDGIIAKKTILSTLQALSKTGLFDVRFNFFF